VESPATGDSSTDPFGFTGFSMKLLARICQPRQVHATELFVNFMCDSILKHARDDSQQAKVTRIDLERWREFRDGTLARHLQAENWPDLFITQLERHISLKRTHILPPEIKRQNETTIYFLIYGTRHWKGVKAMKVAMWKSDRSAAKKLGQASEPLRQQLLEYLATKPPRIEFAIEDLEEYLRSTAHTVRKLSKAY